MTKHSGQTDSRFHRVPLTFTPKHRVHTAETMMDAPGGCFAPGPTGWVSIGNRVRITFTRRTVNVREKSKPSGPEWGEGQNMAPPPPGKGQRLVTRQRAAPVCVCEALSGIRVNRRNPKTMFRAEKKNGSETTQISSPPHRHHSGLFSNLFHVSGRERKVELAAEVCQSETKFRIPTFHPRKEKYSCI